MANWYVITETKELGPFQDAQLRHFAATGKLKPEDIVRREDVSIGRKASDIKGLFPAPELELSMDLDTPPPIPDLPQEVPVVVNQPTLMDRAKQSATNMAEYAKKQTKLKSLEFSEIPALLTKFGTTVFAERLHQDVFADLYAEIDGIDAQVAELRIPLPTSATDTVADRMKRTGTAAVNATKAEACLSNRKKQIQRLGEQFAKAQIVDETSPLQPMISKLRELYLQRDQLKGEIAGIDFKTNIVDGSKQFARETLEGARAGTAWWQKPWFLIASMFFCFPVALGIIWTNRTWEKNRKLRWTAGFVCGFIFLTLSGQRMARIAREEIAAAHEQWKAGEKEVAVIVYRKHLEAGPRDERPLLYGRVIDFELENDNEASAKDLATAALKANINPSVTTVAAKALLKRAETSAEPEAQGLSDTPEAQSASETPDAQSASETPDAASTLSLAAGRSPAKAFLSMLKKKGITFHTPDAGSPIEGTPYAPMADAVGGPCVIHVGGREEYSNKFSIFVVESESQVAAIIIGTPFNPRQETGRGNNVDKAVEAVSYVLPECSLRKLISEQALALSSGGSAIQSYGKAAVGVELGRTELKIVITSK